MARREIVYKFDRLPVGVLTVKGEANVAYLMDGTWSVDLAYVDEAFDALGAEVEWPKRPERPLLRQAIAIFCVTAIQSAVDEAIYRRND